MVFTSPLFLFIFLPVTLFLYGAASCFSVQRLRNRVLFVCSITFYAFSGLQYLLLLVASTCINWLAGLQMEKATDSKKRKIIFLIALAYNIGILMFFKYLNLFDSTISAFVEAVTGKNFPPVFQTIVLPVGISFFTFQIMSYLIDVYQKKVDCQKNFFDLALYIMLFPQLIAGPIVRYSDIRTEIADRKTELNDFYDGIRRFMIGFTKKIMFADPMGYAADLAFGAPAGRGMVYAWIGIIGYTLQIYLDFSAYSDMAIGLGRIFGFHFLENFNYPYLSKSVSEFWRRWHISLSSWFRDYVYIPLGGNRRGDFVTCRNLLVVFALTGFWHGAQWTFLFWGIYFGLLLIVERLFLGKLLKRLPGFIGRFYTLFAVSVGWVFFRAKYFSRAWLYLKDMFSFQMFGNLNRELLDFIANERFLVLLVGALLLCTPVFKEVERRLTAYKLRIAVDLSILIVFFLSVCEMMGSDYNPFIYFRF